MTILSQERLTEAFKCADPMEWIVMGLVKYFEALGGSFSIEVHRVSKAATPSAAAFWVAAVKRFEEGYFYENDVQFCEFLALSECREIDAASAIAQVQRITRERLSQVLLEMLGAPVRAWVMFDRWNYQGVLVETADSFVAYQFLTTE